VIKNGKNLYILRFFCYEKRDIKKFPFYRVLEEALYEHFMFMRFAVIEVYNSNQRVSE
jgi:hypothetical protein